MFWRYRSFKCVRQGEWKLIEADSAWHLFNLNDDIRESKNLIDIQPDKAEELKALLKDWEKSVGKTSEMITN